VSLPNVTELLFQAETKRKKERERNYVIADDVKNYVLLSIPITNFPNEQAPIFLELEFLIKKNSLSLSFSLHWCVKKIVHFANLSNDL
jgi:hypothetical protein